MVDTDGDGQVSEGEFAKMIFRYAPQIPDRPKDGEPLKSGRKSARKHTRKHSARRGHCTTHPSSPYPFVVAWRLLVILICIVLIALY